MINEELKNIFTSYWLYLALKKACEYSLFDIIQFGFDELDKIAENLQFDKKILENLLEILLQNEFIKTENEKYSLTEKGEILAENNAKSLKYSCILWAEEHLTAWQNLDFTLKTGKSSFENVYGINFFDYLAQKPDKLKIYHKAMNEYARDDYENICSIVDFLNYKSILDVGGGLGALISNIAANNPQINCYLFDKNEVIDLIKIKNDIKLIGGNFFENIPAIAECIILSRIIHDWNDEKAKLILQNVYFALPETGTLILIENLTDKLENKASLLTLNMKIITESFERSENEYLQLLESNNFKVKEIKKLNSLQYVFICKKKIE